MDRSQVSISKIGSIGNKLFAPIPINQLCETAFSTLTYLKSKYRSKLIIENDLRLALTKINPNVNDICNQKQAHPSH